MTDASDRTSPAPADVHFPVLESLEITGYGLFPGVGSEGGGLRVDLRPGLTVVLGANGLGKTTLVWILYRLLSGPSDISGIDAHGDLGGRALHARRLPPARLHMFAQRVVDNAENAIARLLFRLGERKLTIARRLADLALLEFKVDDERRPKNEQGYQATIAEFAGLWSFGDWILLLRHLTFYFEDRRELVWDSSAQRQLLRLLFLPAATAQHWTEAERKILKLDSRARNLSAAVSREEKELSAAEELEDSALDVREQLKSLTSMQEADEHRRDELDEQLLDLDVARQDARLVVLKSEQEREATFRGLEHAKLIALQQRFPSASETARYILAQLLTEAECLACGNHVPEVAEALESRLVDSKCVVCGTTLQERERRRSAETAELSDERVFCKAESLEQADAALRSAREGLREHEARYDKARLGLQELDANISRRRERIDALIRRLPKEEAELHEQRDELARMRSRVTSLQLELIQSRALFSTFIADVKLSLMEKAPRIKELFEGFARDFLVEDCTLVWSQRKERVGQSGIQIEFPSFELDMTSASFRSPVRRKGPEQVSESQREFIDLSFRMALMAAADAEYGGTLVIDAPESSLDTVFVNRAVDVLARFALTERGNRLVVTSNLTDGELVPGLLARFKDDWRCRLVDLFEVAEPTAAVRELRDEYRRAKKRIFADLPASVPEGPTS